jgi:hypothetical protein
MMNGYSGFGQEASQLVKNQWPYHEAKNYNDWESIFQAFPHLKQVNAHQEGEPEQNVSGIVIRSANDDNVHKVFIILCRPLSTAFGPPLPRTRADRTTLAAKSQ